MFGNNTNYVRTLNRVRVSVDFLWYNFSPIHSQRNTPHLYYSSYRFERGEKYSSKMLNWNCYFFQIQITLQRLKSKCTRILNDSPIVITALFSFYNECIQTLIFKFYVYFRTNLWWYKIIMVYIIILSIGCLITRKLLVQILAWTHKNFQKKPDLLNNLQWKEIVIIKKKKKLYRPMKFLKRYKKY